MDFQSLLIENHIDLKDSDLQLCNAMESYAAQIEQLEMQYAIESKGEKSTGFVDRIRKSFSKIKKADKSGVKDTDDALEELLAEAEDAAKENDKKEMIKIIMICVGIAALVVALVIFLRKYGTLDRRIETEAKVIQKNFMRISKTQASIDSSSGLKQKMLSMVQTLNKFWYSIRLHVMKLADSNFARTHRYQDARTKSESNDIIHMMQAAKRGVELERLNPEEAAASRAQGRQNGARGPLSAGLFTSDKRRTPENTVAVF